MDKQEEEKKLARETAARLMEKLDVKLKTMGGPVMQNSSSTSSSVSLSASTVATGTKTGAVDSEAKQQLMRALDDRKTYMVEALQMEIALMVNQHRIVDDYQSPVSGPMYGESPHCIVILHAARLHHAHGRLPSHPSPTDLLPHPSLTLKRSSLAQSSCASSRRSASARSRSRDSRRPSTFCFF